MEINDAVMVKCGGHYELARVEAVSFADNGFVRIGDDFFRLNDENKAIFWHYVGKFERSWLGWRFIPK